MNDLIDNLINDLINLIIKIIRFNKPDPFKLPFFNAVEAFKMI